MSSQRPVWTASTSQNTGEPPSTMLSERSPQKSLQTVRDRALTVPETARPGANSRGVVEGLEVGRQW